MEVHSPVQGSAARSLVAAFNGGFQFPSTDGGYFSEARWSSPCGWCGIASHYKNGGDGRGMGEDTRYDPNVVAVRQTSTCSSTTDSSSRT